MRRSENNNRTATLPRMLAWFRRITGSNLPPVDHATAYRLLEWADADGRCWPAVRTVAQAIGRSERFTRASLQRLEQSGLIAFDRRSDGGSGRTHRLRLLFNEPGTACRVQGIENPACDDNRTRHTTTKNPARRAGGTNQNDPDGTKRDSALAPGSGNAHPTRPPRSVAGRPRSLSADGLHRYELLADAGITGSALDELAGDERLSPAEVASVIEKVMRCRTAKNPQALIVHRLRALASTKAGGSDRLLAELIAANPAEGAKLRAASDDISRRRRAPEHIPTAGAIAERAIGPMGD